MLLETIQLLVRLEWPFRLARPLMGRFNPFVAEHRNDPYPHYRALREAAPHYRHPVFRMLILTRYDDVARVLADRRFSVDRTRTPLFHKLVDRRRVRPEFYEAITRSLLMVDPPDHTRLRNLVNKAFTPRVVEGLRPRIQQIVDELLDELAAGEPAGRAEVDFMAQFAFPLPVIVIAELLGVPTRDRGLLKEWSDGLSAILDLLHKPGGIRTAEEAYLKLAAYFGGILEERRQRPQSDLISALVAAEEGGDRLTKGELLSICMLILGAGHETTSNLLGNALWALACHPSARRRLQDDLALTPAAVEEFLRFDSPVQMTDRVASEDGEIGGASVRRGELVGLVLGAANRDPARFAEPDRLDLGRADNRHLAFSWGPHFCLGAALARVEGQISVRTLLERFPDFAVAATPPPPRVRSMVLRGFSRFPVRLGPRARRRRPTAARTEPLTAVTAGGASES